MHDAFQDLWIVRRAALRRLELGDAARGSPRLRRARHGASEGRGAAEEDLGGWRTIPRAVRGEVDSLNSLRHNSLRFFEVKFLEYNI